MLSVSVKNKATRVIPEIIRLIENGSLMSCVNLDNYTNDEKSRIISTNKQLILSSAVVMFGNKTCKRRLSVGALAKCEK